MIAVGKLTTGKCRFKVRSGTTVYPYDSSIVHIARDVGIRATAVIPGSV